MIKCLECGFTSNRLQWTHFKYKCNGKFKNGKEYQQAHPGAPVVDDELKKRQAITIKNMIAKYGKEEGQKRWDIYRNKQAVSNTYEYKKEKYGWSNEEFKKYNQSRSVTLLNLISRHGEEIGTEKWILYCNRQAYTNTKDYFVEKYGQEGIKIYKKICYNKSHTIETVMNRMACSKEEAKSILENRKSSLCFTSQKEIELVNLIEHELGCSLDYTTKTKQYGVYANNKINFYDIVHNNRAIEFNGDYWHCNPKKYPNNYYHKQIGLLAEDIWNNDKVKIEALKSERNIETLVIWEADFNTNLDITVERCVAWLIRKDK